MVTTEVDEKIENLHVKNVISDRLNRFKTFLQQQNIDRFEIECRLKSIEEDFSEFDKIQTRLEYLDDHESDTRLEIESLFYSQISKAKRIIAKCQDEEKINLQGQNFAETRNVTQGTTDAVVNLPELGLPKFYGNCETWFSFWDQFQAIIGGRSDLSEVRKLMYLKSCCQDDALKLIENLDLIANNYSIALDLLKQRFENYRAIINSHINTILFNLPGVPKESPVLLRKLLDSLYQHLSALEKLQLPIHAWDALLIPIILQKLDEKTKREWENKLNDKKLPILKEFTEFLTKKCCTLEAVQVNNQNKVSYQKRVVGHTYTTQKHETFTHHNQIRNNISCFLCKQPHFIYQCPRFANLSIAEKYNELKRNKLCTNCLRLGHTKSECQSRGCKKCNQKHNTALHVERQNNSQNQLHNGNTAQLAQTHDRQGISHVNRGGAQVATSNGDSNVMHSRPTMCIIDQNNSDTLEQDKNHGQNQIISNSVTHSFTAVELNQVLLSTATVLIQNSEKYWVKCTALLDSGSQSNLISKSFCDKLKLNCQAINIPLSGINQIETNINSRTNAKIKSRFDNFETELQFLVLPQITEKLPLRKIEKETLKIPKNLNLADEQFNMPKTIDVLLGAGIFFDLLKHGNIKLGKNQPILQETTLGWIVTGNLQVNHNNVQRQICNLSTQVTNKQLNDSLTKFWQLEELETTVPLSKDDQYCENYFKLTTTRKDNGTFVVKYPFKQNNNEQLGDSKTLALKRFKNLENRFLRNESLKTQYCEFMKEYESLGHMSFHATLENDDSVENKSYFLPHSAVLKESAVTTKCRVVFDASAKTNTNVSFNDLILAGPTIQPDLFTILLRLRLRTYVLNADIKMMYRCIEIEPSERQFQKIFWRNNPEEQLKIYELNTLTYGMASAPFQAQRCLQELAIIHQDKYPRTSEIIKNCFYMDDLLTSVNSKEEALEIYHELNNILLSANFELRKWSSNNTDILNYILKISKSNNENLVLFQKEKELKTLGIRWDANRDELKYCIDINTDENKITKRTILSAISQIFDPLGLIGPAIIKAKLIIQQLWHLQLDWDSEIPSELKNEWIKFSSELHFLNQIKIERHVVSPNAQKFELIGFSDSSEKAYGACVYIASITQGEKGIKLLTAKSRVAPLKCQSLPRLELLAATLLAELVSKIKNILDVKISKVMYFTDSTIVLSWLKIEPCLLKTFVANRVSRITELSNINDWKHVKSKDNAADVISRGISPKELVENKNWFNGPGFLKRQEQFNDTTLEINRETLPELKCQTNSLLAHTQNQQTDFDIFKKYSTYPKLLRIVCYIVRFKTRCLNKIKSNSEFPTIEELNYAEQKLILLAQSQTFTREISELKRSNPINKQSKIINLNPFLDAQGILRVGGRLSKSNITFSQKHPIILPSKHNLTDLIILDEHLKNLHAGTQNLLSIIRLKFWPINGKNSVKQIIKSCLRCYKANPKSGKFLMGELPDSRVNPSRPFTNCGVDYAGPIYIKEGSLRRSKLIKTYLAIFVCFATKAIHIELATDLTTFSFLNVLKRFIARRGKPLNISSDNGLNFVGANNHFVELHKLINDSKHNDMISKSLTKDKINWHFNPARSPHMGGLWEAAVKSTKFHLKRVLGESSLSFEEMYTLLVQVEALLNSRPLTPLSNDPQDFLSLTPAHFLIGDSLVGPPEENVLEVKSTRLNRYYRLQQLKQQFWQRWFKDYLTQLQVRTKWKQDCGDSLKIGSLVILVEENTPPLKWPMARVVELHRGSNNVVRVTTVRLPNGTLLKRAINKVCLLPVEPEHTNEQ